MTVRAGKKIRRKADFLSMSKKKKNYVIHVFLHIIHLYNKSTQPLLLNDDENAI